jgi:hypothetical protein
MFSELKGNTSETQGDISGGSPRYRPGNPYWSICAASIFSDIFELLSGIGRRNRTIPGNGAGTRLEILLVG